MTDNLLQKLEERMMTLLAELENLRKESNRLKQENLQLKGEYNTHLKKLQNLVSVLDSLDGNNIAHAHVHVVKDEHELVDDVVEYATA